LITRKNLFPIKTGTCEPDTDNDQDMCSLKY